MLLTRFYFLLLLAHVTTALAQYPWTFFIDLALLVRGFVRATWMLAGQSEEVHRSCVSAGVAGTLEAIESGSALRPPECVIRRLRELA